MYNNISKDDNKYINYDVGRTGYEEIDTSSIIKLSQEKCQQALLRLENTSKENVKASNKFLSNMRSYRTSALISTALAALIFLAALTILILSAFGVIHPGLFILESSLVVLLISGAVTIFSAGTVRTLINSEHTYRTTIFNPGLKGSSDAIDIIHGLSPMLREMSTRSDTEEKRVKIKKNIDLLSSLEHK